MTTRIPAAAVEALGIQVDKYTLEDFPEVRSLGGTMADLDELMERYGPWMTIGAARELELERRGREGRA